MIRPLLFPIGQSSVSLWWRLVVRTGPQMTPGHPRGETVILFLRRSVFFVAGQVQTESLQITIKDSTDHTHSRMIVQGNLGVGRKHKDPHAVLVGNFLQVHVPHHAQIATGGGNFVVNGLDLDAAKGIDRTMSLFFCSALLPRFF